MRQNLERKAWVWSYRKCKIFFATHSHARACFTCKVKYLTQDSKKITIVIFLHECLKVKCIQTNPYWRSHFGCVRCSYFSAAGRKPPELVEASVQGAPLSVIWDICVQFRSPNTYMRLDGLQMATWWESHNLGGWQPLLYVACSYLPPWCHWFPSLWL